METLIDKAVSASPIRWFGGKGKIKTQVCPLIPYTKIYVEPFGGSGSIFMHRKPSPVEVYNDLDDRLVNLFRVLQDPEKNEILKKRIDETLYSRAEYIKALEMRDSENDVDAAWSFYVIQNQGFAGAANAKTSGTWGRSISEVRSNKASNVNGWQTRIKSFENWKSRLTRCQIDNQDAIKVIKYWDTDDTTFYLDPPYVHDTRTSSNDYVHEQPIEFHQELVKTILDSKGAVVLSGYNHPVYEPLVEAGWKVHVIEATCHAAGRVRGSYIHGGKAPKRTEYVWQNPKAVTLLYGIRLF